MTRFRTQKLVTDVLFPYCFSQILALLKTNPFSIYVDGSRDKAGLNITLIMARIYDPTLKSAKDYCLTLFDHASSTASTHFTYIINFFRKHQIPLKNFISIMLDNTNYNIALSDLLKRQIPKLFCYGCICHKINLIATHLNEFIFSEIFASVNLIVVFIRGSANR